MRDLVGLLITCSALGATAPAFALPLSSDGTGHASHERITVLDRPIAASALLGCEELNVVAPNLIHRAHAPGFEVDWSELLAVWREHFGLGAGGPLEGGAGGGGLGGGGPVPSGPGSGAAIPEPSAALVFTAGLLLASRRRARTHLIR